MRSTRVVVAGVCLTLLVVFAAPATAPLAAAGPMPDPLQVAPATVPGAGPTLRGLSVASEYDAVRVPDAADLQPRRDLTIELWAKRLPAAGCGTLVSKDRARSYWLGLCNGRLRFSAGGPGAEGNMTVPEGRWTHVAVTFDGAMGNFYVNGALDRAAPMPSEQPQANAADLSIGADTVAGSFFYGAIDHVRLWNVVRTADQIQADARATLAPQAGLVAQWPLDGNAHDLAGGHDGRPGVGSFTVDGVLPGGLAIPQAPVRPTVDGRCEPTEYGAAERVALEGTEAVMAYVQSAGDSVFLCVPEMAKPGATTAAVAWHMDRNLSLDSRPQPGDYRFSVKQTGNPVVEEGDGSGWKTVTLGGGTWEGSRTTTNDRWSAELRVARSLFEPPRDPVDPFAAGLAIGYLNVRSNGDDRFWPAAAVTNAPNTWALGTLADTAPAEARFDFAGWAERVDGDGLLLGVPDAIVRLYRVVDDTATLVDATTTDGGGRWQLAWRGVTPDRFVVTEQDPPGTISLAAQAPSPGIMAGANALVYDLEPEDASGDMTFPDARFLDAVGPAAPEPLRRHYLIVYAPPVAEEDLWPIVRAKEDQGYLVTARSTEDLARTTAGRDLAEQVRSWLKAAWEAADEDGEPVYVLLVGRGDRIPVRDVGWLDSDHRDPARPDYFPAWPTDWYYADLDSDWDANGNGYYGEFLGCPPGDTYLVDGEETDCPEEGSLLREGPYGALRGSEDDFQMEVALGRLAVNEPAQVRAALQAMAQAEASTGPEKRRALVAGSFWEYAGQSYAEGSRATVAGGDSEADAWVRQPWTGERPFGYDTADALQQRLLPVLSPLMLQTFRLYETTSPGNDPSLSPSRYSADAGISAASLAEYLGRGPGWVALAGRGGPEGVVSAAWRQDWDVDRRIDQPALPALCLGVPVDDDQVGPPCRELTPETLAAAGLPLDLALPPVMVANAGGTAAIGWNSAGLDGGGSVIQPRLGQPTLAGRLAGRGQIAAWVGSMVPVAPGFLDTFQADVAQQALNRSLPMGDAVGQAMSQLARANEHELRAYGPLLLGDPAYTYWGGAPDGWGAWPEAGGGRRGSGSSPYSGPGVPQQAWAAQDAAPASAPVIGRNGELVVGGSGRVARITSAGTMVAQASLPGGALARYPAALGADQVWLASGGTVYLFSGSLSAVAEVRLPSGATATGGPRLGVLGEAYVGSQLGLVRLDGAGRATLVSSEGVRGTPALRPSGELVWSNAAGRVEGYRVLQDGQAVRRDLVNQDLGQLTAPAVSPEGTVYVGSDSGRVYGLPEDGSSWQLEAGSPVRLRPAVARDGTVYVANSRGQLLAFAAERRDLLWRAELGATAGASPTVDANHVYVAAGRRLVAVSRATGLVAWSMDLGGATDDRSEPVIGPDRTLYVTRADQTLVAVREAGWLAAPSDVQLEPTAAGGTVRWRDNSTEEIGFRVDLCDLAGRCLAAGTAAAGATRLDVRQGLVAVGEPFLARVQALGRADEGDLAAYGLQGPGDVNHDSELIASAPAPAVPGLPAVPTAVSAAAVAADTVELRWTYQGDPAALTGFDVARETRSGWHVMAALGADERVFVDHDLQPDRSYHYAITAVGSRGSSSQATTSVTTWRETLAPAAGLTATARRGGVLLAWQELNLREDGVVVERLDPGMAQYRTVAQLAPDATSLLDTYYLTPGTYTYRVRPVADEVGAPWRNVTVRYSGGVLSSLFLPVTYRPR